MRRARLEVVIFVGLQASGKSNFYRERFATTHLHISKDLMRNVRRKQERQMRLVEDALGSGMSVVIDNTNPRRDDRAVLIEAARRHRARVTAYIFESTVSESIHRNAGRSGPARVPAVAIYVTAKRLERPSYDEGLDRIYRVWIRDRNFVVRTMRRASGVRRPRPREAFAMKQGPESSSTSSVTN